MIGDADANADIMPSDVKAHAETRTFAFLFVIILFLQV
jgi:hypothetical protein